MRTMTGFMKGINLGGWLSQCSGEPAHLDSFITEPDFAQIAQWGFDHVRIPFDYNYFENEDGSAYLEEGFARLERAVGYARKNGLNVILDLHKTAGFSFDDYGEDEHGFFDSEALQARFCRLWQEIARRFGNDPAHIAFELLNEITDKDYLPVWKQIVPKCIAGIREHAPEVLILVGSYWNNAASAVKDLDAPQDKNVIYNMHCYEPLKFTHQGAYWTDQINPDERIPFAESGANEAYFEELFASAIAKAEEYGTSLYCGEYGIIDRVSPEDTLAWYRTIHAVFEKHGIGRALWTYRGMDFGITDARLDGIRDELFRFV